MTIWSKPLFKHVTLKDKFMTSIINRPELVKSQAIKGYLKAHPQLSKLDNLPIICQAKQDPHIIPIISGGGSGHEPAHSGFVGQGMLTAAVYGEMFTPPSPQDLLATLRQVNQGRGVFAIIKNFEADLQVFREAIRLARLENIPVKYVVSHDDISVDTKNHFQVRHRGLAGTILLHKILGAAAQEGAELDQLEKLGLEVSTAIATIGFAMTAPHLPGASQPLFDLREGQISYGIGIHGEEGYRTVQLRSSEELANEIVNKLKLHFRWHENDKFILLVNNLGTTSELEQAVFLNDICQLLELEGLQLPFIKTGRFMTSLDMKGISVTLCRLKDDIWLDYLNSPTQAPAW